jgi:hypothetical protein
MPGPAIVPFLPLIGTAVSSLAGAIGNIFGNKSRKREANRSRAHDLHMWDKTNAYNHPSAQMERLRNSGLNPNLVYGGSSGGTAGTANALPGAKDAKINDISIGENPMMQYVSMKNTQAQTDNLRTQNGVLSAEKNLKTVQAITEASKQNNLNSSAEYNSGLLKKALQDVKKSIQDTETSRLENIYKVEENKRAKNGQMRGDNAEKVLLDKILNMGNDLYNGQVPEPWQQFGTGIPRIKG